MQAISSGVQPIETQRYEQNAVANRSGRGSDCRKCFGSGPRSGVYVVVDIGLGIVKTAYFAKITTSGDLEWQL